MWFISKGFPKYLVNIDIKIIIDIKQVFTILNIIVDMILKKHGRTKASKNLLVFYTYLALIPYHLFSGLVFIHVSYFNRYLAYSLQNSYII